jgi:5-(carboxyamino)imidazole ribonucleotide synthase
MIGILGGGQLGRMLALAGYPLGLRFRFLDAAPDAPAGQLGECIVGAFDDPSSLERFAQGLELVTYEFENVPVDTARFLAARLPVYPPPQALAAAQDRFVEKTFFQDLEIPTPLFAAVDHHSSLATAAARVGCPAVLKTRRFGYDGKGQCLVRDAAELERAWGKFHDVPLILESFVHFEREVSLLAARSRRGETVYYPLVENHHHHGILCRSLLPAPGITPELQLQAEQYAARLLDALQYVGVLAIEFFQRDGQLLVNEMAPRVHNSGHGTIEGATTSQFENHLRAVLGLPLGSTASTGHTIMVNLIGTLPPVAEVLAIPGAHLHLYGKAPRPRRKLGHVTLRHGDPSTLAARLAQLQDLLDESNGAHSSR